MITIDPDRLRGGTGTGQLLHTGASISAGAVQQIACDAEISVYRPNRDPNGYPHRQRRR